MTLHVEQEDIEPAVVIYVERAGVAGPTCVDKPDLFAHVFKLVVAVIAIEQTSFGPFGLEVARKGVLEANEISTLSLLVGRVDAYIGQQQVQQTVPVVIEEDGSG